MNPINIPIPRLVTKWHIGQAAKESLDENVASIVDEMQSVLDQMEPALKAEFGKSFTAINLTPLFKGDYYDFSLGSDLGSDYFTITVSFLYSDGYANEDLPVKIFYETDGSKRQAMIAAVVVSFVERYKNKMRVEREADEKAARHNYEVLKKRFGT